MRLFAVIFCALFLCFTNTSLAFAQSVTPAVNGEIDQSASGSGVLNSFIAGFDWISSGLVFYTPSLMDNTIKLQDGTELAGMSQFRNIFYDIAVPLFVLITSFIALSHISNDNSVQLKQFFQRLVLVVMLFLLTPSILTYSIQFVNLLNDKIIAQNAYNLSTLINNFLGSFMQIPMFRNSTGVSFGFSWNNVLQLIIFIISIGFLLIGFIYIIFQAVIRFIALLTLSVIFPIVLPFALAGKTENIANTYFRTWFSFLIQQPAFVLGFAIVSVLLTSILQAHNNSIGTLFVYSAALIFLGGINVFISRIFGEGWEMMTTNAQSMIGAKMVQRNINQVAKGTKVTNIPAYAGKFVKDRVGTITKQLIHGEKSKEKTTAKETKEKQTINTFRENLKRDYMKANGSDQKQVNVINKKDIANPVQTISNQTESTKQKPSGTKNNQINTSPVGQTAVVKPKSAILTKRPNPIKPIVKRKRISI